MFDFAKYVLGRTYVLVFIMGMLLTMLLVGPVAERNMPIAIVLILGGTVASMFLASHVKFYVMDQAEKRDAAKKQE